MKMKLFVFASDNIFFLSFVCFIFSSPSSSTTLHFREATDELFSLIYSCSMRIPLLRIVNLFLTSEWNHLDVRYFLTPPSLPHIPSKSDIEKVFSSHIGFFSSSLSFFSTLHSHRQQNEGKMCYSATISFLLFFLSFFV